MEICEKWAQVYALTVYNMTYILWAVELKSLCLTLILILILIPTVTLILTHSSINSIKAWKEEEQKMKYVIFFYPYYAQAIIWIEHQNFDNKNITFFIRYKFLLTSKGEFSFHITQLWLIYLYVNYTFYRLKQ